MVLISPRRTQAGAALRGLRVRSVKARHGESLCLERWAARGQVRPIVVSELGCGHLHRPAVAFAGPVV